MIKRIFDTIAAVCGLIIFFPAFLWIGFSVHRKLGSPVLFKQIRPGLNGAPFRMFKFRTMLNSIDDGGGSLSDSERLTSFGMSLRSSSLDELPELWNVLRGEMSLVGPRPLLMEYIPLYNSEQFRRHEVRPGITGWAQVNGRNSLSWEEKFDLDIWYVDNRTMWLDLKIIFLTLKKVFLREGISSEGDVTMPKFKGNKQ